MSFLQKNVAKKLPWNRNWSTFAHPSKLQLNLTNSAPATLYQQNVGLRTANRPEFRDISNAQSDTSNAGDTKA
jgi:hypothetical protein